MGSKGAVYSNDLLKLIFNATPISNIADNSSTSPLTSLYLSLHTAQPTPGGTQATSEVSYPSYARRSIARSTAGFVVTGQGVSLAAASTFPSSTAGSTTQTATYFGIGVSSTAAGKILYSGLITPSLSIVGGGSAPVLDITTGGTET